MKGIGRKHPANTDNKRLLIWTSYVCHRRRTAGKNQQVEEYKHTHTHTYTHTYTLLVNGEIINHLKTLWDLRLISSAVSAVLIKKKRKEEKIKTKALLKVIDDIIIEYSNTTDFIQQKLNKKCDKEGISTDKVNFV